MKKIWLLLLALFLVPIGFADLYEVNTSVTFYSDLYNATVLYVLPFPEVNTSVYNSNDQLVYTGTMLEQTGSRYAINITFNETGEFYRITNYTSAGSLVAQSSESFSIVSDLNNIAQDVVELQEMVWSTFILFAVGFLIAILGFFLRVPAFYIFSAVYYMGSSVNLVFTGQGWTFPTFFMLFGLLLAYKGIYDYWLEFQQRKKTNINEFDDIE